MASLKEIRARTNSIQNTSKITHAMELVAAAKMKRAQDLAISGKPYSELINDIIRSIANRIDRDLHPLLARTVGETSAVIFFSTDRGLAGSLNSNLFRELERLIGKLKFITIGKKARQFIVRSNRELIADFPLPEKPDIAACRPIANLVIEEFLKKNIDQVHILYTEFISTLKQVAVVRQLLPIIDEKILAELAKESVKQEKLGVEPLFEPDPDIVLEAILPQYILMELYQILLEEKASEHSARMIAMKNATENALELVDDLTLTYNGIRQEAITKEILDISTAATALE
ncbi:MAG: ATP synthase F1 subunit gamma [Candidatus Woykebacteria bacterium RIFCSPHIGHO2_01_FULL_39_12]|uniref:ATP synthase gamma chain n=2 Tax=Candidatus Woykeibacteriota TaxID=1817899 RepID=A0A1G1WBU7_9BACT|nr:MAG: ATP synthase F1 subunit gamma [Candidatus Woykebacteria bacterium RBG_16_39_9b]OGY27366.1 MAG: ATP synthase F1 subunit gamma [Candidatus Woykebacteria bacterium RIFCSPHIGHO2_01_FULL_39_12]